VDDHGAEIGIGQAQGALDLFGLQVSLAEWDFGIAEGVEDEIKLS
jgi:hypothetical protein